MLQAEKDAIQEVMDEAEPLINDPHRGFKGFLPAVFAYRVAEHFNRKMGKLAYVKLTAPAELIRHRPNMPDAWEDQIIKSKFQSAEWKKGDFVEQEAQHAIDRTPPWHAQSSWGDARAAQPIARWTGARKHSFGLSH